MNAKDLLPYTKNLSVLYAEDEEGIAQNFCETLQIFFSHVQWAKNGYEAFQYYQNRRYDILITDIRMPIMDGIELIEKIQTLHKEQSIIVISAHSETPYIIDLINKGIHKFITKPFHSQNVLNALYDIAKIIYNQHQLHHYIDQLELLSDELHSKNQQLEATVQLLATKDETIAQKDAIILHQNRTTAMGDMAAMIAHQWRQPLNLLALWIQELNDSSEPLPPDSLQEFTSKSLETLTKLSLTIEHFENYYRPLTQKKLIQPNKLISNLLSLVDGLLTIHHITLSTTLTYNEPILCWEELLTQILVALVTNSCEALITSSSKSPTITIDIQLINNQYHISISDNGGGIPDEIYTHLYEPYCSNKAKTGKGLSLYLAKATMKTYMNGDLVLKNIPQGTQAILTFS